MTFQLPLEHVWQPAAKPSGSLMVVLHGRGDSAEGFLWLQEALRIEGMNVLLLNAPDPYYTGFSWYDLPPSQLPGIQRSRALLTETLEELRRTGFEPSETFILGFSQGCLLTLEFGARYAHVLAGYVGISGYCYAPEVLLREMNPAVNEGNWLITHGTEDEVLPVRVTREQVRELQAGGFRIDYREYRKGHSIDAWKELPEIQAWVRSRIEAAEARRAPRRGHRLPSW